MARLYLIPKYIKHSPGKKLTHNRQDPPSRLQGRRNQNAPPNREYRTAKRKITSNIAFFL